MGQGAILVAAFWGVFIWKEFKGALSADKPIREAIEFAQKAAAISVTRMGAQPSAPDLKEIEEFNLTVKQN